MRASSARARAVRASRSSSPAACRSHPGVGDVGARLRDGLARGLLVARAGARAAPL